MSIKTKKFRSRLSSLLHQKPSPTVSTLFHKYSRFATINRQIFRTQISIKSILSFRQQTKTWLATSTLSAEDSPAAFFAPSENVKIMMMFGFDARKLNGDKNYFANIEQRIKWTEILQKVTRGRQRVALIIMLSRETRVFHQSWTSGT